MLTGKMVSPPFLHILSFCHWKVTFIVFLVYSNSDRNWSTPFVWPTNQWVTDALHDKHPFVLRFINANVLRKWLTDVKMLHISSSTWNIQWSQWQQNSSQSCYYIPATSCCAVLEQTSELSAEGHKWKFLKGFKKYDTIVESKQCQITSASFWCILYNMSGIVSTHYSFRVCFMTRQCGLVSIHECCSGTRWAPPANSTMVYKKWCLLGRLFAVNRRPLCCSSDKYREGKYVNH